MLNLEKSEFLSKEQLKEVCPVIFADKASKEVSKHYTHIPTSKVIDDMATLGWNVVDAKAVKARKESTQGYQKHLVVFRNDDVIINGQGGDTVFPQVLLTNSHDGKNAFTFTAGLFRMVCENGLVISTTQFEDVKMRHMGYSFEELQVKIRFNDDELKRIKIDFKDLLNPTRDEDKGNDLWSVFNVVQEKIIDGDFEYKVAGKLRKARQIKNFKQDQKINKELFDVALEFAK
jgi:hypothetical protein